MLLSLLPARRLTSFLFGVLLALLFLLQAVAQSPQAVPLASRPLADALTPTGELRPEISGSLDPTGYRMTLDPETGKPTFQLARPQALGDERWQPGFGVPGAGVLNGYGDIRQAAVGAAGELYVCGQLNFVDTVMANGVARWNGTKWERLGDGPVGTDSRAFVTAMAVDGTTIYVAGQYVDLSNRRVYYVAKWDGAAWQTLSTAFNASIEVIAIAGGDVYVGGYFSMVGSVITNGVAKWNGTAWVAVGALGSQIGFVRALAVDGSTLYAAGSFNSPVSGGVANNIARWDGTAWHTLGAGCNDWVSTVTLMGGDVYAGGRFTEAGGQSVNRVARWNGTTWSSLGAGAFIGDSLSEVTKLQVAGTRLTALVSLSNRGVLSYRYLQWTGNAWAAALPAGLACKYSWVAASGNHVYAGSQYSSYSQDSVGIAYSSGGAWQPLVSGLNGEVYALAVSGNDIYVGGEFTHAGYISAHNIARWDGTSWHELGAGITNSTYSGQVLALAVSGPNLYVGGNFQSIGGQVVHCVARWDGTSWSALGSGVSSNVRALAVVGTDLYVGGEFSTAGNIPSRGIARWDGTTWHALGSGVNSDVYALVTDGTTLYAGGRFTQAGGQATSGVARWNGATWSPMAAGIVASSARVLSLALMGQTVYAGGSFLLNTTSIDNQDIARWDGTTWQPIDSSRSIGLLYVTALLVHGGSIYVGHAGWTGPDGFNKICRWNGTHWYHVGSGLSLHVNALASKGSDICMGGGFSSTGDNKIVSSYFAVYRTGPLGLPAELVASDGPRLDVFPNPATATSLVQLQEPAKSPVELLDMAGRHVRHYPTGTTTLDIAHLSPGVYIVRVGSGARRLVVE